MMSTATVSPSARPNPSIEAAITPLRPNGSTVIRTTSHLVAPKARAASICIRGVCRKTSRDTEVTIGRIIAESTTPAVKMVPPPASETSPCLNRKNQPRLRFRNCANGFNVGASTKMPHNPKTIDGTAASRSTIAPNGRDSRAGAYWVRNTAIPIATGTASARAASELSSVTINKSRMPKARCCGFVVSNLALVKKFASFALKDGMARTNRNTAISTTANTTVEPAADAMVRKIRSERPTARTLVTVRA